MKRRSVQANIPRAAARSAAKRTRLIGDDYRTANGYIRRMALNKELIDILACPKCKGPLKLRGDESAFECGACKLAYPIVDDIPNFILEEAQPLRRLSPPTGSGPPSCPRRFFALPEGSLKLDAMSTDRRRAPQERRQTDRVPAIFAVKKAIAGSGGKSRSSSARPRTSRPPA